MRILLPWSHGGWGSQYNFAVPATGATLCTHEIVIFAYAVQMWPFYPNGVGLYMGATAYYLLMMAHNAIALNIELENTNSPLTIVLGGTIYRTVVYNVALPIFVEEEGGIYTIYFW